MAGDNFMLTKKGRTFMQNIFFDTKKVKPYEKDDVDFGKLNTRKCFDMLSDLIIATGEENPPMILTLVDGTIISGSFYSYDGKHISILGYHIISKDMGSITKKHDDSIIIVGLEKILYFETKKQ